MIIPTAQFDPMYADDGVPFRSKLTAWIRREFADILGPDHFLLDSEEGLDSLLNLVKSRAVERGLVPVGR